MPTQTETKPQDGQPFLLGRWLVEPTLNRLTLGTTSVQLEHKAMDVLLCLVEHAGEVVTKSDLLDAVWQTEFVSDNTLQGRIAEIRDAVGDDAQNPSFIETIRKRGYRLICEIGDPDLDDPVQSLPNSPTKLNEERNPYPGLAAFTEAESDVFFGREREIAALWRKITSRRLLAVIGPSGIGKSSLLRAGVATRAPPGWKVLVFTPRENPAMSLARALAPDHAGDPAAVSRLVGFNDPDTALAVVSRWRGQFDEVVLVVDQFEELFTLSTPEVQERFVGLLRRLVDAADVHVVLAMRDDFLFRCEAFPEIAPVFDGLTPLGPPRADALRRAITGPAARFEHCFESEVLVDQMVEEVDGQRGALPLLAFALRRLWEKRDPQRKLLTEQAYGDIGGVAGALARHAEAVVTEIGHARLPVVREIFRNLVTAEGTRAVREVDELLSVFNGERGEGVKPSPTTIATTLARQTVGAGFTPARNAAQEVLDKLIDARLLTSFETHEDEELATQRVEIVHESLLANWPRLVRWQTQDADAAQLRDQLRQAARTWEEHKRGKDYLWAGKAYREFAVWREHYSGGLSELEDDFARSMTEHAKRRTRTRRSIGVSVVVFLLAGLAVVGTLWQRSDRETRRAEAQKLYALAQIELGTDSTSALAHSIASLELADDPEVRKLAVESLWRGPQRFMVDDRPSWWLSFTPGGDRLVLSMETGKGPQIEVLSPDGTRLVLDRLHRNTRVDTSIAPDGSLFASWDWSNAPEAKTVALWSMAASRPVATHDYANHVRFEAVAWRGRSLLIFVVEHGKRSLDALSEDLGYQRLGAIAESYEHLSVDQRSGRWIGAINGDEVAVFEIDDSSLGPPRIFGLHPGAISTDLHPLGEFLVTASPDGEIRFWDPDGSPDSRALAGPSNLTGVSLMGDGSVLTAYSRAGDEAIADLWSLTEAVPRFLRHYRGDVPFPDSWDPAGRRFLSFLGGFKPPTLLLLSTPPESEPIPLGGHSWGLGFHPAGDWMTTTQYEGAQLWHLARPLSVVIGRSEHPVFDLEFERNGRFLAAAGGRNFWVRIWPLEGDVPAAARTMADSGRHGHIYGVAVAPDGENILGLTQTFVGLLQSTAGGPVRVLRGAQDVLASGAFSPSGRLVAAPTVRFSSVPSAVHIWDVDSGGHLTEVVTGSDSYRDLHFLSEDRFLVATTDGLISFSFDGDPGMTLLAGSFRRFSMSGDSRLALLLEGEEPAGGPERALVLDLDTKKATPLTSHGSGISAVAIGPSGTIAVTGNSDGEVRVGPITGEEPHLLLGHSETIETVAVDPLGRWIASGSRDTTVRLWPMPDLTKPPLHTLPREELIAKLKTLTNLRVVRDPKSSTGWKLTHNPFPGWETVPTW